MSKSRDRRRRADRRKQEQPQTPERNANDLILERWHRADPSVQAALLRRAGHPLLKGRGA